MIQKLFTSLRHTPTQNSLMHDAYFNELRAKEYARLDNAGHVYLDYTGGNLYAESQLLQHQALLRENVFGNPIPQIHLRNSQPNSPKKPDKKY